MKTPRYLLFLIISLGLNQSAMTQNFSDHQEQLDELVQELIQLQEVEIDYEDVYESLLQFYSSPLNLNTATREELEQLFMLSPLQLTNLLEYRQQTGPLLSLYELQVIPGMDLATIKKIGPFVTLRPNVEVKGFLRHLFARTNHYLLLRYGRSLGKNEVVNHLGDANRYYVRYKNSKPGSFSYGITFDKDAGERSIWNPMDNYYGFDFTSYHFTVFNKGKIKAISFGDYQLQFGQGLVVSSGFRLGKGSETILSIKKTASGIKPYSSSLEYGFFRGAAITLSTGNAAITGFYSNKFSDGSIREDQTFSLSETGYHRTRQELDKRNAVREQIFGGNLSLHNRVRNLHGGVTFAGTLYDHPLQKTAALYNQFEYSGSSNFTAGADLNYTYQNYILFTEAAISKSGGKGLVAGMMTSLSRQIEASVLYRKYERDFHSFYGNGFGENTRNINESGLYIGLKFKPSSKWLFTCYYDRFKFPWLKYLVDAPSRGEEYLGRISFLPGKAALMYFQFRQENKEKNLSPNTSAMDLPVMHFKQNYLYHIEVKASSQLTFRARVQFSTYEQGGTKTSGYAMMQELDMTFSRLSLSLRYTLYDTEDYNNRQYIYERDVLYSFSIPSYQGQGSRIYGIVKFRILKQLDSWIKYSTTFNLEDQGISDIGSGELGKSDLKIQLRYTFH